MTTPNPIRARVTAIYLLLVGLIGPGLGPTVVALITDYVFHDPMAVGESIALIGLLGYGFAAVTLFAVIKPFKQQMAEVMDSEAGGLIVPTNTPPTSSIAAECPTP